MERGDFLFWQCVFFYSSFLGSRSRLLARLLVSFVQFITILILSRARTSFFSPLSLTLSRSLLFWLISICLPKNELALSVALRHFLLAALRHFYRLSDQKKRRNDRKTFNARVSNRQSYCLHQQTIYLTQFICKSRHFSSCSMTMAWLGLACVIFFSPFQVRL